MSKNIVITGSSRGIGLGLAEHFLRRGCRVVINGRSDESCTRAVSHLQTIIPAGQLAAQPGDVADEAAMEQLWETAVSHFGRVDLWINNAGLGHNMEPAWELPLDRIQNVIEGNILGLVVCSRIAVTNMMKQGDGQIYNMEGFGSNGQTRPGMSIYGTSKAAVHYFSKSLIEETKDTPVLVGTLSPGMVFTDLLLDPLQADPAVRRRSERIFNILADTVDTVTPWLVEQILANQQHGRAIQWLTTRKIIWRFLTAPFSKRDLFAAHGR